MNAPIANRQLPTAKLPHNNLGYRNDFEQILGMLDMDYTNHTENQWSVITSKNDSLNISKRSIPQKKVPNVVGMGLRDALYLLENKGLRVKVVGVGKVKRQSVEVLGGVCFFECFCKYTDYHVKRDTKNFSNSFQLFSSR